MLQTLLLLLKSLNKTETPICLSVVCFFVSKGNLFDVYFINLTQYFVFISYVRVLLYKMK